MGLVACLPWLAGRRFVPWDSLYAFYPMSNFAVTSALAGQAPWWNPGMFGGQPMLGDPQSLLFTMHSIAGLIAGSAYNLPVFDAVTVLYPLAGAIALHAYARAEGGGRTGAIIGATVYMIGGVATSRLQHVPQIVSYGLMPVILLALRQICLRPTALVAAALAAVLLATLLNPNQVVFLSALALAPFALLHLARARHPGRALLAIAAAAGVACLAASPVLAAMGEFISLSNRASLPLQASAPSSLPFFDLLSFVLPGLYGSLSPDMRNWAPTDLTESFLYIGVIPAGIVCLALVSAPRLAPVPALSLSMAAFWFVFAMGLNAPLYPALFEHLPGATLFKRPADGAFALNLMLALVVGTIRLPGRSPPRWWSVALLTAAAALAMRGLWRYASATGHLPDLAHALIGCGERCMVILPLCFLWWRGRRSPGVGRRVPSLPGIGLAGVALADLLLGGRLGPLFAPSYGASADAQMYRGGALAPGAAAMRRQIDFLRAKFATNGIPPGRVEVLGGGAAATMPTVFGLSMIEGFDPIGLAGFASVVGHQNLQNNPKKFTAAAPSYAAPAYRRLGLRDILLNRAITANPSPFGAAGTAIAQVRGALAADSAAHLLPLDGPYEIWERTDAMPPAGLVFHTQGAAGTCHVTTYQNTVLHIACESTAPALLVLGEAYAPGWTGCVNGAPVPVVAYDTMFRAVEVPRGISDIAMLYQPVPFLRCARCANTQEK